MLVENVLEKDDADDEFPTRIEGLILAAANEITFGADRDLDGRGGNGLGEGLGDGVVERLTDFGEVVVPVVGEIALDAKDSVKVVGGWSTGGEIVGELIIALVEDGFELVLGRGREVVPC